MYPGQQMPQLPFHPTQLMRAPLQISLNNPPFVPNIPTHPQIQPLVPLIAAASALEVQNKAQLNPLRTFMFNQFGHNNFANPDFENLVRNVVEYVHYYTFVRPEYNNLEFAVQDAVPKVVEMVCGMSVREFPGLEAYCTPETIRAVYASNARFMSIGAEIQAYRQRASMQQSQMHGGWQGQQMMQVQQPMMQPGYPRQGMSPTAHALPQVQGGSSIFVSQAAPRQPDTQSAAGAADSRWAAAADRYKAAAPQQIAQPVQAQQPQQILQQPYNPRPTFEQAVNEMPAQQVETKIEGELITYKDGMWTPKPGWSSWYLPAYNPLTHKLFVKTKPDGSLIPVVQEREMMDYEKHRIKTVFGPIDAGQELAKEARFMPELDKRLDELSAVVAETEGDDGYNPTHVFGKATIADTALPLLWYVMHREYFEQGSQKGYPDAFTTSAQLCDVVLSLKDDSAALTQLREAATYGEFRQLAIRLHNEGAMSPQLFGNLRKRMTDLINRELSQNLAIPRLQIESFMDAQEDGENDYNELLTYLEQVYGPLVLSKFQKQQRANIENYLRAVEKEVADAFNDLTEKEIENGVKFCCFSMNVTMTLINCTSQELEVELFKDVGAVLTTQFTPVMLKIVKRIFQNLDDPNQFARHLIRTTDGVVLEVARGYLADDCYTLSRIE